MNDKWKEGDRVVVHFRAGDFKLVLTAGDANDLNEGENPWYPWFLFLVERRD